MVPVKSSQIESIGYGPATKTLAVKFTKGGEYHYENVPAEKHAGLMASHSKGTFLHTAIKPHHPFKKVGALL